MIPTEAEKIVNQYGGAIAQDSKLFKKASTLPCSKAKIRQAFFTIISTIISKKGALQEDTGDNFVTTYCMLDTFIEDEDAERLNAFFEKYQNNKIDKESPKNKEKISKILSLWNSRMRNGIYFDEINEYINECSGGENMKGLYSVNEIVKEIESNE